MVQDFSAPKLPKQLNKATGKESNWECTFCNTGNAEGWGLATHSFAKSTCGLSD